MAEYKKKGKSGQVTMFIIVGIVILFAFAFVFYIANSAPKKPKPGITQTARIPADVLPVQNYVTSCLDLVAKDGLELLGKQGGRIKIEGREGVHFVKDGVDIVPYWIFRSSWEGDSKIAKRFPPSTSLFKSYYSSPEKYPWPDFPDNPDGKGIISLTGVFGEVKLMPLEKKNNANSIQEQLENYISSGVRSRCSDFGQFESQGLVVNFATPAAEATIGAEDVVVRLSYPLEIKKKAGGESVKISEFYSNPQIRLKKVYEFANRIAEKDIQGDMEFKITEQENEDGAISVVNVKEAGHDSIVTITDAKPGKTGYIFSFAIMNRRPAIKENAFADPVSPPDLNNNPSGYAYDSDYLDSSVKGRLAFTSSNCNVGICTIDVKDKGLNDYKTGVRVT